MTPERWRQIQAHMEVAHSLTTDGRKSFLERIAAQDWDLREELESFFSLAEADTGFLKTGAMGDRLEHIVSGVPSRGSLIGRILGAYKIIELLGTGGMGEVYRAVRADGHYEQQVALKIVRLDFPGELARARFQNERQILANLDHPNIAKILDGGTSSDGLSYFVMDLIDGLPINEYCEQKALSVEERFTMFRTVCSAVHYAHQHLVVHRDIKPSNILVTPEGSPKLLDFGIAKILAGEAMPDKATVTRTGLMTPEYASPEQLTGQPITTTSDVYSLGLVLYELLTGRPAYRLRGRSPLDVAKAILESEPQKPSSAIFSKSDEGRETSRWLQGETPAHPIRKNSLHELYSPRKLRGRLRGDPDSIVLKALRKDPRHRYASADQLSEDIRRHLEGLPVLARKGTASYRLRKYMVRHKVGVIACGVAFLLCIAGALAILREARIAEANEIRAERSLQRTRELTDALIEDLPGALDNGPTHAKVLMNGTAVEYLQQLIQDERNNPKVSLELALAHLRLGESLGNPGFGNLGDSSRSIENYDQAIALFERQLGADPSNRKVRLFLAHAYVGRSLAALGSNVSEALSLQQRALQVLPATDPSDLPTELERQQIYELIGEQFGDPYFPNLGDTSQAQDNIRKAIAIAEALNTSHPDSHNIRQLYYSNIQLAGILWARGQIREALDYQHRGEAVLASMPSSSSADLSRGAKVVAGNSQIIREERAMAITRRANLLLQSGKQNEAQSALQASRSMLESLLWNDSMNAGVRRDLTRNYNLTGSFLLQSGKPKEAVAFYHRALALNTEILALRPDQQDVRERLADSCEGMGSSLASTGKLSAARDYFQRALIIRDSLVKLDPLDARYQFLLAENHVSFARSFLRIEPSDAENHFRLALAIQQRLATIDPANALLARSIADVESKLRALHQR